jgi:hypothetical protein
MKRLISVILAAVILALVAGVASAVIYPAANPGEKQRLQEKSVEPGSVFYVNSSTGSDADGYGRDPATPYDTVDYAIGKCTGGKGDIIYVLPGHNEGGSAAIFDADTTGISIVGLGSGSNRPRFDFDNTAAKISIGSDNVTLKNLTFLPSVSAVVVGIDVEASADHVTIENCEFMVGEAAGTDEFVSSIVLNSGASDAVITGNKFFTAIADTHCTNAINLGVAGAVARVEISNNFFYGNWSTAAIIDGTTAVTELLIKNNDIKVKDGEPAIELEAATTGLIVNNVIESTGVTCSAAIVAADASWFDNKCVNADGLASTLIGEDAAVGTTFMVTKAVAHTALVTGGLALTGAASGTLVLEEVIILNGSTALGAAGATSLALYTDNTQGSAVFVLWADTVFTAGAAVDTNQLPGSTVGQATAKAKTTVLLTGKKLYIKESAANANTDGNMTIYMIFRRMSVGATIAAS